MIFLVALLPATMLTVAGYFVLYLSHRSEGGLRSFGRYLSFWAFALAVLVVLGSVVVAARGDHMHGCMMHGCEGEGMGGQCPMMHSWHHGMPGGMPGMIRIEPGPVTTLPAPPPPEGAPRAPAAAPGAPPPK